MSSTKWSSELRDLFKSTKARFPNQHFEEETLRAWQQDWREWLDQVGWSRFEQGVRRARTTTDFFPTINLIRKLTPEHSNDNEAFRIEMNDLRKRKREGERFYTLADVFVEFRKRVESGEVQGRDERGQRALNQWAHKLRGSERAYAAKVLTEIDHIRKASDFEDLTGSRESHNVYSDDRKEELDDQADMLKPQYQEEEIKTEE